MIKIDLENFTQ